MKQSLSQNTRMLASWQSRVTQCVLASIRLQMSQPWPLYMLTDQILIGLMHLKRTVSSTYYSWQCVYTKRPKWSNIELDKGLPLIVEHTGSTVGQQTAKPKPKDSLQKKDRKNMSYMHAALHKHSYFKSFGTKAGVRIMKWDKWVS